MSILANLVDMDHAVSRAVLEWMPGAPRVLRGLIAPGVGNVLVKGGVPAAVFWYLWFPEPDRPDRRPALISTLITTAVAIAIGRLLANLLPFRTRPLASAEIVGANAQHDRFLDEWSSMPSDHALMFFAMAGCIVMISRPAGIGLFIHAAVFDASRDLLARLARFLGP